MGILNVTPDSFSDGGQFASIDAGLRQAERMITEGVDVIDVGGESTRPGSSRVGINDEIDRVVPVIAGIARRSDIPISIDTTKNQVATAALDAGAEIINDISGLRFDEGLAELAARTGSGLVLMHSRGDFDTMHSQPPAENILDEVRNDFHRAATAAIAAGVSRSQIVLDIGVGFGKTLVQNLELIAKLDRIESEFPEFPMLVGTSRKSFIARVLTDPPTHERLAGSLASAMYAVMRGASIIRVHDVKPHVEMLQICAAIQEQEV
jgi:dihydropteroate synthase